jgi:DNA-binding MarR family transcriptional regulator
VLIDKMAARGLVERRRSSTDGRALDVLLTAEGEALARTAHGKSLSMEDGLLQRLSPGERVMLRELLVKFWGGAAG